MLADIETDIRSLLSAEFSTPAVIKILRGSTLTTVSLNGIFDRTYTEINSEGLAVTSKNSRLTVAEDEWLEATGFELKNGEPDYKTEVTISTLPGIRFSIFDAQSDGQGMSALYLRNVSRNT
jgi:hypothetical protein